jgi:protein O-GlcNAc transferase
MGCPEQLENAHTLLRTGDAITAASQFRRLLSVDPNDLAALEGLGRAAYQAGDLRIAEKCFRMLASKHAGADPKGMLGVVLLDLGRAVEAETALAEAVRFAPDHAVWLMNHGNALRALRREEEASRCFRAALAADPHLAEAALNLGDLLHGQGLWREADEAWARAEAIRPDWAMVHWKRLFAPLPTLSESEEEIEACRAEFARRLQAFADDLPHDFSLATVSLAQPFLLAYQGRDDGALMRLYGKLIEVAAQRSLPHYRKPIRRPVPHGERMRVGFASAFFCSHSVWKIPLRGWIEGLDITKFETFCYHLGTRCDEVTDQAAAVADHFHKGPKSLSQWADCIAGDRLHALIYPEIGMDALTIQLAALRLAPVQAVGLGHPQTTGLSTVDVMLSSVLMQPDQPVESYTETLMTLPGIGVAYKPRPAHPRAASRAELNVEEDAVLFWCCHYISKYEPRHDAMYPSIARRLPQARFLFLGPVRGTAGFDILRRRLTAAFAAQGLNAEQHVRLLPRLTTDQFDAVSRACDLFLDNPGWSGFNSALECLAVGLPVLTCRGPTVRANHAAAVLERIGLGDFVVDDMEGLANMAVLLGKDAEARAVLSTRIAQGLPRLYEDQDPVRALEEWLWKVSHGVS